MKSIDFPTIVHVNNKQLILTCQLIRHCPLTFHTELYV